MNLTFNYGIVWRLRNAEHFNFHYEIVDSLKENMDGLASVEKSFIYYKSLFDKEDVIFKQSRRMRETNDIIRADELRSSILVSFSTAIRAAVKSVNENMREAGNLLEFAIDAYKDIHRVSMGARTSYIINLLEDMDQVENREAVTLIDQSETVNLLSQSNEAFREIYNQRTDHIWDKKVLGNMSSIKPPVNHAFKDLLAEIKLLYESNKRTVPYSMELEDKLDVIIKEINAILNNAYRIVAYRNAGNGSGPKPPVPPVDEVYSFTAASQTVYGEGDNKMLITDPNPLSFESALYNKALGGVLDIEGESYKVIDFYKEDGKENFSGLIVEIIGDFVFNGELMDPEPAGPSTLVKEENIVAIIEGLVKPRLYMN